MNITEYNELLPTRQSLLDRLKDWSDQESWKTFFDAYWKLIYTAAIRAGLSDAEAQDVVQETVISVSRSMPNFVYDPAKGSFKSWLLKMTSWRILDQMRRRQRDANNEIVGGEAGAKFLDIEDIPAPVSAVEAMWEEEWESNLLDAAVEKVKRKVDPKQYQVFDLYAVKKWPIAKVARTLKVSRGMVYLAKHRIGTMIKKEVSQLQTKPL